MAVTPTPPGVLYRCENKRVAEKGFCKAMKTKGRCGEGDAEMQRVLSLLIVWRNGSRLG